VICKNCINSPAASLTKNVIKIFNWSTASLTMTFTDQSCDMLNSCNKLCWRPPQYAPTPASYLWPFDLESGVRVTCDVGYLCANFSLPRPLCSLLKPDVCDRQMSDAHQTFCYMHAFLKDNVWKTHTSKFVVNLVFKMLICMENEV